MFGAETFEIEHEMFIVYHIYEAAVAVPLADRLKCTRTYS